MKNLTSSATPGPWRVTLGGNIGPDGLVVARAYYFRTPVGKANARLIAAAPDMLAFLRSIVPGSIYQHEIDGLIARAEGRNP